MQVNGSSRFDRSRLIVLDESPVGYSWRVALQHCSLPLRLPLPSSFITSRSSTKTQRTVSVSKLVCLTLGVQSKQTNLDSSGCKCQVQNEATLLRSSGSSSEPGHVVSELFCPEGFAIYRATVSAGCCSFVQRNLLSVRLKAGQTIWPNSLVVHDPPQHAIVLHKVGLATFPRWNHVRFSPALGFFVLA